MKVDFYDYNGLGYVVDPESDTKIVPVILIGPQLVKCNPRPAVIYVAGGKVDEKYTKLEELKKYCGDNKVVFLCPKSDDLNGLAETYKYATEKFKDLNIIPDQISVKAVAGYVEAAQELADYIYDEYDIELPKVEEFTV